MARIRLGILSQTFKIEVGIVQNSSSINSYGVYELYVRILSNDPGYLWRIETTGAGQFDAWNFDFVSDLPGSKQYSKINKYILPDNSCSIVSSLQCSDEVITVGNYAACNTYYDLNKTLRSMEETSGEMVTTSSLGPTRINEFKPDIAAAGTNVFSCALTNHSNKNGSTNLAFQSPDGLHVLCGGTSIASPVVAGWVALYLQANPLATNRMIKKALISTCSADDFTKGVPNNKWGYGKLDGFKAFNYKIK